MRQSFGPPYSNTNTNHLTDTNSSNWGGKPAITAIIMTKKYIIKYLKNASNGQRDHTSNNISWKGYFHI
jgi:hypothetical protein